MALATLHPPHHHPRRLACRRRMVACLAAVRGGIHGLSRVSRSGSSGDGWQKTANAALTGQWFFSWQHFVMALSVCTRGSRSGTSALHPCTPLGADTRLAKPSLKGRGATAPASPDSIRSRARTVGSQACLGCTVTSERKSWFGAPPRSQIVQWVGVDEVRVVDGAEIGRVVKRAFSQRHRAFAAEAAGHVLYALLDRGLSRIP
jgi:hypothetical protein